MALLSSQLNTVRAGILILGAKKMMIGERDGVSAFLALEIPESGRGLQKTKRKFPDRMAYQIEETSREEKVKNPYNERRRKGEGRCVHSILLNPHRGLVRIDSCPGPTEESGGSSKTLSGQLMQTARCKGTF